MQSKIARLGLLVAVLTSLCLPGAASAQFFRGGDSVNNPPVNQREFNMMVKMLNFDEVQQEIASDMFAVLQDEFGEMSSVAQEMQRGAREEFQRNRDPSVWREYGERMARFEDRREELGEQFWADVKILLTEEQVPLWEDFERRRFRGRAITRQEQVLSGVGVDLVILTEEMELDPEQQELIKPTMTQYEVELDRKLRSYRRIADEQAERAEKLGQDGNWMQNMDAYNEIFATVRDELVGVRAIHEKYLKQLTAMLGEEPSAELMERFNKAAYPDIYRDSYVDNGLRQVLELDSLSAEQREYVTALKQNWEQESQRMRETLVRAQREREENMRLQDMWGGNRNPEAREAQSNLRETQLRYYDQLLEVLSEDQKVGLPERPATDWRERDFDF
ncbi:MAG: hypothetical protein NXI14_02515 [bacterium]|nr:hypothetical protein [bacterium]